MQKLLSIKKIIAVIMIITLVLQSTVVFASNDLDENGEQTITETVETTAVEVLDETSAVK